MTDVNVGNRLFGATTMNVGLSSVAIFSPGRGVVDYIFSKVGTGGSLFISGGSLAANIGAGYLAGNTTEYRAFGPAQMFLSSVGATTVVQFMLMYSAGYSSPVNG